ncbi:hypothetical protein SAMN04515621_1014 [Erythrobacter sp. HL-111]|nr:MAG: hypothetical protein HLUCCO15_02785 [Erythrobacteraceae bacterium HL-111]SDS13260.1 hypothetical protein SAMN04515621_1014 [Erythrobacter sp. HL-111]
MIRDLFSNFRSKTWAADTIRRYMPTREQMAKNRWLAPIAHRFLSPELWRFTRRSVPRGVALGLFAAFIIPLGQIFLAAFLALPARANVPLAALVTFVTNPFTLAFWIVIANRIGAFMLRIDAATAGYATGQIENTWWQAFVDFSQMAGVTVVGFLVLAIVSAGLGYVVASAIWRVIVARKRAKRLALMEARLDRRLNAN